MNDQDAGGGGRRRSRRGGRGGQRRPREGQAILAGHGASAPGGAGRKETIAFLGAGNMGRCLIGGMVADGYDPNRIVAADPDASGLNNLHATFGIRSATDNLSAVAAADVVVLAVKPQIMRAVALEMAPALTARRPLIISVAAGIRTADLSRWLGGGVPVVRVMPNTPALVRSGAAALFATPGVGEYQRQIAEAILRSVGLTLWLGSEDLMDAVTALSGSGPAYFFLTMEILEDVGVRLGLSRDQARLLTVQTAFGAAKLALEAAADPKTLREQVTSPGGTTERALESLRASGIEAAWEGALFAAAARSRELADTLGHADPEGGAGAETIGRADAEGLTDPLEHTAPMDRTDLMDLMDLMEHTAPMERMDNVADTEPAGQLDAEKGADAAGPTDAAVPAKPARRPRNPRAPAARRADPAVPDPAVPDPAGPASTEAQAERPDTVGGSPE